MSISSEKGRIDGKTINLAQPLPKLSIPVIPKEFLERPRLRKRFDAALCRKVIMITAPAGYGKTVFLSEALTNINHPVAWLSLDKRDNYLAVFWTSLIMAIQKVQPGLGEHSLAMLRFSKPSLEEALTELINEISKVVPDLIIVLDDYHEINSKDIHDSLAFMLQYLPTEVHLFIVSRIETPLTLERLRGRGHLAEIKSTDLQFTEEETYAFLNEVMGFTLSKEQVNSLHNRTEGWIAGLQMVALSLQGRHDVADFMLLLNGTSKEILEYLSREVVGQQEEHIRSFLLETCILERLTKSLCKAVTGRDDSQLILEQIVANHLFLQPLDEEGRWFRYHNLFRDLLYKQLEITQPELLPVLHSRASEWYERQGQIEDAIEHSLVAQEFDRAGNLIQRIAFTVMGQDKYNMVQDWLARLPESYVTKNLRICIVGAVSHEVIRQPEGEEPFIRYTRLMSKALETPMGAGSLDANTTRGFLSVVMALGNYNSGHILQAIKLCRQGLKSLPENEAMARAALNQLLGIAYWSRGELAASYRHSEECIRLSKLVQYSYPAVQATATIAHVRFAWGHLQSAAEACREAIQLGTGNDGKETTALCYPYLLLGEILYQWNHLEESRGNVIRAIKLSQEHPEPVIHLNGHMALARIAIAQGKTDAAIEIARHSRITHKNTAGYRIPVDVFMTRLWLMAGNVAAASDYTHTWTGILSTLSDDLAQKNISDEIIKRGIYVSDIRDMWSETPLLNIVRLRLAQGKLEGLLELLENVQRNLDMKGWTSTLAETLILKSLVFHAEGKLTHALKTLESAFVITEKEGYIRIFVDEGLPLFQLLQRAASRGITSEYVIKLLSAFDIPASNNSQRSVQLKSEDNIISRSSRAYSNIMEPLTRREIEVVELVAAGLPNREIANKLTISLYTVKNHLKNIYQKLDVNNRARAIVQAQEMGLLKINSSRM